MARTRVTSVAVAVVAALALAGCWPAVGQNPDRTAANPFEDRLTTATVRGMDELWRTAVGPGAVGPPVAHGGGIVARSSFGALTRVDARTGAHEWTWRVPDDPNEFVAVSDPHLVDGRLLIGYGVRTFWGSSWVDPVTGAGLGDAGWDGLVRAVRGDRAVLETHSYGSLTPVGVNFAVADLATGTYSGGLAAVVDGGGPMPQWTLGAEALFNSGPGVPAGDDLTRDAPVVRAFPLAGITGGCGPAHAPYYACPTWATDVGALPTAPVVGPGGTTVYVGTAAGEVVALDAATGAVRWRAAVGAAVDQPPALAEGVLYVGTAEGKVVAVDAACGAATCPPRWSATVGSGAVVTQPAVGGSGAGAVVYAATAGGDVAAVAAAGCAPRPTCPRLWRGSVAGGVTAGPIVSGGRVVVGTADGHLVAFGLPSG